MKKNAAVLCGLLVVSIQCIAQDRPKAPFEIKGLALKMTAAEFQEKYPSARCMDYSGSSRRFGERVCTFYSPSGGLILLPLDLETIAGREVQNYAFSFIAGKVESLLVTLPPDAFPNVNEALARRYGRPKVERGTMSWSSGQQRLILEHDARGVIISLESDVMRRWSREWSKKARDDL